MKQKTCISFNHARYQKFLSEIGTALINGELTFTACQRITEGYRNSEGGEIVFRFESVAAYEAFIRKLSRLGMGESISLQELDSHVEDLARRNYQTSLFREDLEQQVQNAMNQVFLGQAASIDAAVYCAAARDYASAYFLRLLQNRPKLEESPRRSVQAIVEYALCAYLPFRGNNTGFLVEEPRLESNRAIARMLIAKMEQSTYTNVKMFLRVATILLGSRLRSLPGYRQYGEYVPIIESSHPKDFKDEKTLAHINTVLKAQVEEEARLVYNLPR